jgi:microcystin-dependent protein
MPVIGHGVDVCTSLSRPHDPTAGQIIFETDTASHRWWNGSGWKGVIPVGTVQPFSGANAPDGWLFCAGQTLNSITSVIYADLYATIGVSYGGSGAGSFIVPDMRGRAPFGKDDMGGATASRITATSGITGTTLGAVGGDQRIQAHTHTFSGTTGNDSPDHSHTRAVYGGSFGDGSGAASWFTGFPVREVRSSSGASARHQHSYSGTTANHNQTAGGASQNMPPTIVLNYIIKY